MPSSQLRPSKLTVLMRGSYGACGVCGKWRLSRNWLNVTERCPRCDFPIERKEGHFVGAVGMNTIITFGVVLFMIIGGLIVTAGEPLPVGRLSLITAGVAIVFGIVFYPISRTLWSAIDLLIVPLEPGEVDPRFDPHVTIEPSDAETNDDEAAS